jgi:hypothetical protein
LNTRAGARGVEMGNILALDGKKEDTQAELTKN